MLEPGDILLVKGKGFIASLIQWFTRSEYSHAMLYIGQMYNECLVVEASAMGVWINTLRAHSYEYDRINAYRVIDAPAEYRHQTPGAAFEYVARPYGFLDLVGFAFALATGLKANPLDNSASVICSELVDRAYWGLWSLEEQTSGLISPATLSRSRHTKRLGGLQEVLAHA